MRVADTLTQDVWYCNEGNDEEEEAKDISLFNPVFRPNYLPIFEEKGATVLVSAR